MAKLGLRRRNIQASRPQRESQYAKLGGEQLEPRLVLATLTVNSFADYSVNTPTDPTTLTLREAMKAINQGGMTGIAYPAGAVVASSWGVNDRIEFNTSVFGTTPRTIALSPAAGSLQLYSAGSVEIVGFSDSSLLAIDGGGSSFTWGLFQGSAAAMSISGLTFKGGNSTGYAGAMNIGGGQITLQDLVFSDNHSSSGGALNLYLSEGDTGLIEDCVFTGNTATQDGGAISLFSTFAAVCEIENTIFKNNEASGSGGAIYASVYDGGGLSIAKSQFIENDAGVNGGGIYVRSGYSEGFDESWLGNFTLEESVLDNNDAGDSGGGIFLHSVSTGSSSSQVEYRFSRNSITRNTALGSGGGIGLWSYVLDDSHLARTVIEDCTVAWNKAAGGTRYDDFDSHMQNEFPGGGGGIALNRVDDLNASVTFQLINSTISGNEAESGGGLLLDGAMSIQHSTIAFNRAGILDFRESRDWYDDDNDPDPDGTEYEHVGGGGVLIRNADPRDDGGRPLPTFSHTIVARNTDVLTDSDSHLDAASSNISVYYADGGWPDEIPVYFDLTGKQLHLGDLCLADDAPPDFPYDWSDFVKKYYVTLQFDYSLIDDRSGPLEQCGPTPREGQLMAFADDTYVKVDELTDPNAPDPLILPLSKNGGFRLPGGAEILTHALTCDSLAVDAGDPSFTSPSNWPTKVGGPIDKDERGDGYTRIYDIDSITRVINSIYRGPIDIGAFELGPQDPALGGSAADFDNDGDVDSNDLKVWVANFGRTYVSHAQGDADGDNDVDDEDLRIWGEQFGTNVPLIGRDADFDNNGVINGADFIIWQQHFNESGASNAQGDANADGKVDGIDFLIWQREIGAIADCNGHVRAFDLYRQFEDGKIVVSTLSDVDDGYYGLGQLSLREALYIASQNSGLDEIVFADNVRGTILLSSQLFVGSEVKITGPGAGVLTIDASGGDPDVESDDGDGIRAFSISSTAIATISGLTVTGGDVGEYGGGIRNSGALTLDRVVVQRNYAAYYGGGIFVDSTGTLSMTDSTIDGNEAGGVGGGLLAWAKDGTSLGASGSTISINRSTISNNEAPYGGGAHFQSVAYVTTAEVLITNSTISGNTSLATGGVSFQNSSNTRMAAVLVNTTIAYNEATSATIGVGGIYNINLTGTDHATHGRDAVFLYNTIVADNVSAKASSVQGWGNINGTSAKPSRYNLIETTYANIGIVGGTNGNIVGVDPQLAALANNGGAAKTHALLPGSQAINNSVVYHADFSGYGTGPNDQRGRTRYGLPDIGSYERGLVVSTKFDVVNGNYGHGDLSLREALALADASLFKQTIEFDPSVWDQTISLVSGLGQLVIADGVEILGPGYGRLTIASGGSHRVLTVDSGVAATISGVTITGGGGVTEGGGILNLGNLTLREAVVSGNTSSSAGGGIQSRNGSSGPASLHVIDSTIDNNHSVTGSGLNVSVNGGVLEIVGSTISNNTGLGLASSIYSEGGGLAVAGSSTGVVTIYNSTFSGNAALYSGGIRLHNNYATTTIVNSTIAFNRGNESGGLQRLGTSSAVTLHNTIVAENRNHNNTADLDVAGALATGSSRNLIGRGGAGGLTDNDAYGNLVLTAGENAGLAVLDDNGGQTKTHALLEVSQAIDHGGNDWANSFEFDQRRQSRFRDGNIDGLVVVDIGAYEVDADEFFETLGA